MTTMDGKVALITGASSGIGRATAEAFAANGCRVALAARRADELEALAGEIRSRGGTVTYRKTDVSTASDVRQLVEHTVETFGRLDYAVNNAGVEGEFHPVVGFPEEEWDRVMDINVKGVFLAMKYEAAAMLAAKTGGAIVNVGSVNSFLGFPTGSAYVTSKHALVGLTSSVSAELAPKGIRVNLLCPGIIDTPMHRRLRGLIGDDLYDTVIAHRVHTRRAGLSEEMAKTILFLCSDEASYITGTTLTADGGFASTI